MGNLLDRHGRLVEGHSGNLEDMDKVVHKTLKLQMTEMAFHQGLDRAAKGRVEMKKEVQRLRRSHGLLAKRVRLLERRKLGVKRGSVKKGEWDGESWTGLMICLGTKKGSKTVTEAP